MWHKYVQNAVMNYNTTYHETLGCEPSTVFQGRIPYNVLDLKLGIKPKWKTTPNSDIAEQLQKQIDEVRATTKDNIMLSYLKYKKYYDRKASAAPLKVIDYCYILNPKADNQSTKFAFQDRIWTGPYIVIKVLSNNNYTIRKLGTRYTQTLQRIRILPYVTVRSNEYLPDPDVKVSHNEWYAVSWEMDFGKQIDENEISEGTETNQQVVIQEETNTNDRMTKRRRLKRQETKPKAQTKWRRRHRIFQILLQTWGITHIYVATHTSEVHPAPRKPRLQ